MSIQLPESALVCVVLYGGVLYMALHLALAQVERHIVKHKLGSRAIFVLLEQHTTLRFLFQLAYSRKYEPVDIYDTLRRSSHKGVVLRLAVFLSVAGLMMIGLVDQWFAFTILADRVLISFTILLSLYTLWRAFRMRTRLQVG